MAQARPVDEKRTEALEPLKLNAKKRGAKAPKRRTRKSRVTATRSRTKPADKLTKQQTCLDLLGGEILHKDQAYPGEHSPIVDHDLWQEVQNDLGGKPG